jgi:conjugal transfer pilus assembly protein TraI
LATLVTTSGGARLHYHSKGCGLPLLANEVLGAERLGTLDSQVLTDLFGAINPDSRPSGAETLLHKVVRQAIEALTQFEVKARRAEFAPDATPAPSADRLSAAPAGSSAGTIGAATSHR